MSTCNLVSLSAYGQFNKDLARRLGLKPAIYISAISDIAYKVDKKKAYDPVTGIWTLDRDYLENQTTLTVEEQLECENIFIQLKAMERIPCKKNNQLIVYMDIVLDLIMDRVEIPESVFEHKEAKKKLTKKEAILQQLKNSILDQDPEIKQAYENWVDVVYEKGVCKIAQVQAFVSDVNTLTQTKQQKLDLINTCMKAGYKIAVWGTKKSYVSAPTYSRLPEQQISDGNLGTDEF